MTDQIQNPAQPGLGLTPPAEPAAPPTQPAQPSPPPQAPAPPVPPPPDPVREFVRTVTGGATDDPAALANYLAQTTPIVNQLYQAASQQQTEDVKTQAQREYEELVNKTMTGKKEIVPALAAALAAQEERLIARSAQVTQALSAQQVQERDAVMAKRAQFFHQNDDLAVYAPVIDQMVLQGIPPGQAGKMIRTLGAEAASKIVMADERGKLPMAQEAPKPQYGYPLPPTSFAPLSEPRREQTDASAIDKLEEQLRSAKTDADLDKAWEAVTDAKVRGW